LRAYRVASSEQPRAPLELERDALRAERGRGALARRAVPLWAERLVRALDDFLRIPGTPIGIGLDSVIGFFVPGAGDAVTAFGSLSILWLAWRRGAPTPVLARMLLNIGIDALVGAVPVLGDLFDVVWKSNRKNLELLGQWENNPHAPRSATDYLILGLALSLVMLSVLLPLFVVFVVGSRLLGALER
jgi:hypothetical protein